MKLDNFYREPFIYKFSFNLKYFLSLLLWIFFLWSPVDAKSDDTSLTKVTLQLKWYHQFQFAGYYAAKEKGFYKAAGLEVEIIEGGPDLSVQDSVLSGKADFGVLGSELLFLRAKGLKIVALAPIMQHSIRTIIARKDKNIASPHDLIGKNIMLNENELPEFQAMFLNEGVNIETVNILSKNKTANNKFISGQIDAMNGSLANQPFLFEEKGIPFNLIRPITYGIDFYGDTLFTTQEKVKKKPTLISAFMNASFKGWEYAFANPDELIDIILKEYHSLTSEDNLDFEQKQLRNLIHPDLVEIGHNNPERWRHIKETYQKLGMVSPDFSLEGFLYQDYHPSGSVWINRLLMILGLVLIFSTLIFIYNFQLRKNVKKITREIQESREYLNITLRSIGDAVISVDLSGNIVTMNPVAEKLTGWSLTDAFGRELTTVFHIVHAKTRKMAENPIKRVLENGRVVGLASHTLLIARDGTEYQISDSCAPIKDAQGVILGVVMVFSDVTEECQHLEQISSLGKFPSENPNPVMRVTPDGTLRYANKGSRSLLKLWGCDVGDFIPEKWSQRVFQAMETGQIKQHEEKYSKGILSLVITPVKEMGYVNIYGMDITEQKEHFERFQTVMDGLDSLVYVADMNTYEILFVNQYGVDIWGDIRGTICWQSLQNDQTGPCSFCTNDQLLDSNGAPVAPIVWEFQNTVNHEWYECRDQAIRWMDGRMVRMEIASNITRRKEAEKQRKSLEEHLRQSQKMEAIGTIAGGIAHDFNNILGIIIGNTELALDDVPDWNPARENLKQIKTAGMRASDLVKQLLSFSRKSSESIKNINIREILVETISLIRASIPASIEIRTQLSEKKKLIKADPTQIHQVLINLCTNAAHAMEEKGGVLSVILSEIELDELTITQYQAIKPGYYVQLTISDTGCGIDPRIKDKIFDPYFTTKEIGKGTGMGLAVVAGIIKNYNGAITVYSEKGHGSTFKVLFPVAKGDASEDKTIFKELPKGVERILWVDDETALVKIGKDLLEKLGYQVDTQTNPVEALNLFRTDPSRFDLIITDVTMPHLSGDQLMKSVLKINPKMPVILCSGFSDKIDGETAMKMGAHSYIEKPLDKDRLAFTVRKAIDDRRNLV